MFFFIIYLIFRIFKIISLRFIFVSLIYFLCTFLIGLDFYVTLFFSLFIFITTSLFPLLHYLSQLLMIRSQIGQTEIERLYCDILLDRKEFCTLKIIIKIKHIRVLKLNPDSSMKYNFLILYIENQLH